MSLSRLLQTLPIECIHKILAYSYNPQPKVLMDEIKQTPEKNALVRELVYRIIETFGSIYQPGTIKQVLISFFSSTNFGGRKLNARAVSILKKPTTTTGNCAKKIQFLICASEVRELLQALDWIAIFGYSMRGNRMPTWMRAETGGLKPAYREMAAKMGVFDQGILH